MYSTCSVMVEENEEVVEYALRKRPNVRIVPTGIDFGRDGLKCFRGKKFDERMTFCRRIFVRIFRTACFRTFAHDFTNTCLAACAQYGWFLRLQA